MVDVEKFEKALRHLSAQYENYAMLDEREFLIPLDREAIAESVIQRFEVCYDCLWKTLKHYLSGEFGLAGLPNSPKPLFRIAFENGLFAGIAPWLAYANARVATSHDYSEEKAQVLLALVGAFINDAKALYSVMAGRDWHD